MESGYWRLSRRTRPRHSDGRRYKRSRLNAPGAPGLPRQAAGRQFRVRRRGSGAAPIAGVGRGTGCGKATPTGCSRTSYEAHEAISSSARAPTPRPTHARAGNGHHARIMLECRSSCNRDHRAGGLIGAPIGDQRHEPDRTEISVSSPAWSRRTRSSRGSPTPSSIGTTITPPIASWSASTGGTSVAAAVTTIARTAPAPASRECRRPSSR